MNKYLTALTMLCVLGFSSEVPAQTFMRRIHTQVQPETVQTRTVGTEAVKTGEIVSEEGGLTPEELAAIENKLNARVTAAEKVEMQAPIRKSNKIVSRNMRPEEARRLVDALNAVEKIKARRANLSSKSGKLQQAEKIKINVYDSKQIEQLLNQQTLGDEPQSAAVSEQ